MASRTDGSRSARFIPRTTWWRARLACLGERFSGSCGSSATISVVIWSGGAMSWVNRLLGIAQDNEKCSQPRFTQVEGRPKNRQTPDRASPSGPPPRTRRRTWSGMSSSRHRASLKLNISVPSAKTLISCEGVSTRQTCPPDRVALAWLEVSARAGMHERFASLRGVGPARRCRPSAPGRPGRSTRKTVRTPSQRR